MVGIFTLISITLTDLFLDILTKQSEGLTANEQGWMTFFIFVHFFLGTPFCLMTRQWGLANAKAELDLQSGNQQVSLQKGGSDASHTMEQALELLDNKISKPLKWGNGERL